MKIQGRCHRFAFLISRLIASFFVLLVAFLFLLAFEGPAFAHGGGDDDPEVLKALYTGILENLKKASETKDLSPSDRGVLQYGSDKIYFRQSAFSAAVMETLKAQTQELHHVCHHCELHNETKSRLLTLAKLKAIQISAFAYKGFKQYGIPYALFFVVFETTEHTLMAWLPPMCPVYHAMYFAVSDFLRKVSLFFKPKTGLELPERARAVAAAIYLDIAFWNKLRTLAFSDSSFKLSKSSYKKDTKVQTRQRALSLTKRQSKPAEAALSSSSYWGEAWYAYHEETGFESQFNLEQDLDFIFSAAPPHERYWVAKRQVDGFELMIEFLNDLVAHRYEEQEISAPHLLRLYGLLGQVGKALNGYHDRLKMFSAVPDGSTLQRQKSEIKEVLEQLYNFLEMAPGVYFPGNTDSVEAERRLFSWVKRMPGNCSLLMRLIR